jgi:hypothetical protein
MLRRVTLVGTDISDECIASIIDELGATLASQSASVDSYGYVPSSPILVTMMIEALSSSEAQFLQEPRGVTSQKTQFFIVIAVKPQILYIVYFTLH